MPTGLPDDLHRPSQERDGYRCRECGVAVATDRAGCPAKLMTLCFPCYATKGLRAHADVLRVAVPDRLPEFVKQMTWDFGLNLLAYSGWIDPVDSTRRRCSKGLPCGSGISIRSPSLRAMRGRAAQSLILRADAGR